MASTITPIGIGGAAMTLPAHAEHGRPGWSGRRVLAVLVIAWS
jgi:hypothetical protein